MTKFKIGDEWWTTPTESENGNRIIVTGRRGVENAIASGKFNDRIEITWKYDSDKNGMPDFKTSSLMEAVTDALNAAFKKDQAAILTGIYTRNLKKFQYILNDALHDMEVLPLTFYAENDPDWEEYQEMKVKTEILEEE